MSPFLELSTEKIVTCNRFHLPLDRGFYRLTLIRLGRLVPTVTLGTSYYCKKSLS